MPQPNLSEATDVVSDHDVAAAILHPDRGDLGQQFAAGRCPSRNGADYRMPLAGVPALTESGV